MVLVCREFLDCATDSRQVVCVSLRFDVSLMYIAVDKCLMDCVDGNMEVHVV